MRFKLLAVLLCCSFVVSACTQGVVDTYGGGVGTELSYSTMGQRTAAEDNYVTFICRQSGSAPGICSVDWQGFTLAGMNDIDARCDGYLAWLDNRRRTNGPIQKQIADTATTTATVMAATGATGTAIGIVAAAFGFARNSFDNTQSRLLMEVNHSTVQTIVLSNQERFRKEFALVRVENRPTAIYVLRQYLRLCMPYTIENQINTTITTYQLGGTRALESAEKTPLIDLAFLRRESLKPEKAVYRPPNPPIDSNSKYELISTKANLRSTKLIQSALTAICASPEEVDNPTPHTVVLVKVLQQYRKIRKSVPGKVLDGKMDDGDLAEVAGLPPCSLSTAQNFYEQKAYPSGIMSASNSLIELINGRLAEADRLPAGADEPTIRAGIAKVRADPSLGLELNDPTLSKQLTAELIDKL
ncbi:hypothetical protein [Rhizobium sp. PEPV16]|uniref:hypothetical protein n=1 Tax=Rhizobium sp. PEPV16 TaxID=1820614 RepID=UPI00124C2DB1|nr:hypothetical protein [Rhizobium sp. PEPV16]KAF5880464.1 hypothetical protein FY112_34790 [Rhizobium sp. PEPV16]